MSKAKHTPGPWHVGEMCKNQIRIEHDRRNVPGAIGTIAFVVARISWVQEGESNARLIAAAPALLAACEVALPLAEAWESTDGDYSVALISQIKDAIALAKGEAKP